MKNLFYPADILLPKNETDINTWAVLACDQFTSQPEYWENVERKIGANSSTYNIILPEVYLEAEDVAQRIDATHKSMDDYLKNILCRHVQGFIYVERKVAGKVRQGLVGCIDLEDYSFEKNAKVKIKPSENTVIERIPPRLAVRKGASIESPHILMLIDDEEKTVIEPLSEHKSEENTLYEGELMLGGGYIKAWSVTDEKIIGNIQNNINKLDNKEEFNKKYNSKDKDVFVMAVGDGNHSLATAKSYWEEIKKELHEKEIKNHPARFCLVELENIQTDAIEIEPIHRVLFNANYNDVVKEFNEFCEKSTSDSVNLQEFVFVQKGREDKKVSYENMKWPLAVGTLEAFLSYYKNKNPDIKIDYIHGENSVKELSAENEVGILLPPFEKGDLFKGVALGGVLPKKTFSMGHAEDKRYYLECRKIIK